MASRRTTETTYLVVWPDHMIVKAGVTNGRRWANFLSRGAVLYRLAIFEFADWRLAMAHETELDNYFGSHCDPAFATREDSIQLIGGLGGYREMHRLENWDVLRRAPAPGPRARLWTAHDYYATPPLPTEAFA
jgi:hypothetical protein